MLTIATRRTACVLGLLVHVACSGSEPMPALPKLGGVVLVSIDTLRADHLGSYGYTRETSPFLDQLAEQGVLFEEAVSSSSWTLPAHATLLTGLYPSTHRAVDARSSISGDARPLAELFRAAGWATGAVVSSTFVSRRYGFDRGFDHFEDFGDRSRDWRNPIRGDVVVDHAVDWLEALPSGQRFFLFVHLYDVHYDYQPPENHGTFFDTGYDGPDQQYRNYFYYLDHPLSAARLEHEIAMYDGEIRWVDAQLSRLSDELERLGLSSGSLWVVTSDHGEEFFERGAWGHAHTLYDEQVRVPLIVTGPGVARGRRLSGQVGHVDVFPTLVEAAGLQADPESGPPRVGRSLAPWLMPGAPPPLGSPHQLLETSRFDTNKVGVRGDGWKLVRDLRTDSEELFRVSDDSLELVDLKGRDPAVLAALGRELNQLVAGAVPDRWHLAWLGEGESRGRLETSGHFVAVRGSGPDAVLEPTPGESSFEFRLRSGAWVEAVVLPVDAEVRLTATEGRDPMPVWVGSASEPTITSRLAVTAVSPHILGSRDEPAREGLSFWLSQSFSSASEVELDEASRRELEALGYLID